MLKGPKFLCIYVVNTTMVDFEVLKPIKTYTFEYSFKYLIRKTTPFNFQFAL